MVTQNLVRRKIDFYGGWLLSSQSNDLTDQITEITPHVRTFPELPSNISTMEDVRNGAVTLQDQGGFYPDPDPTYNEKKQKFEPTVNKKTNPDPALKKQPVLTWLN